MGFGVLYVAEWMRRQPRDRRIAFARRWLGQILGSLLDRPGTRSCSPASSGGCARPAWRTRRPWLRGCCASRRRATPRTWPKRRPGAQVPHLLKSARRAGLLEPEILDALGIAGHPLIRGALRGAETESRD
jgi:hypothetical protein